MSYAFFELILETLPMWHLATFFCFIRSVMKIDVKSKENYIVEQEVLALITQFGKLIVIENNQLLLHNGLA